MEDPIIKVEHVSKQYTLGAIGGTTLRDELQRRSAKRHHKEDPTVKIGQEQNSTHIGEKFYALDDVSFEVKKGEALGIIGRNGAGKSTLLKLLCRVTAPTKGTISYDGKIASMLEVGTGFHPELTGRENIYLNGAILGMTRAEIDSKMNDIIEFSECGQFIDTPVKRYSSGMYVKLAFSVAAHLDAEIMIMDEVLAVGDMAFQKKCIDKMKENSTQEGRTILYVSHNMNTIRQLCDRCIVLDHGKKIFEGDVNEAISYYYGTHTEDYCTHFDLSGKNRLEDSSHQIIFKDLTIINKEENVFDRGEKIRLAFRYKAKENIFNARILCIIEDDGGLIAGTMVSKELEPSYIEEGNHQIEIELDTSNLGDGKYFFNLEISEFAENGTCHALGHVSRACTVNITSLWDEKNHVNWHRSWYGDVVLPEINII